MTAKAFESVVATVRLNSRELKEFIRNERNGISFSIKGLSFHLLENCTEWSVSRSTQGKVVFEGALDYNLGFAASEVLAIYQEAKKVANVTLEIRRNGDIYLSSSKGKIALFVEGVEKGTRFPAQASA